MSGRVVNTAQIGAVVEPERHLRAVRAADPVALHRHDPLGPAHLLEVVQQPVGVGRDLEEPLLQRARLDLGAAALAAAVDDLLVGQHRLVVGTPVDGRALAVGQAGLVQAQEDPLRPAVVLRLGGRELAVPVDRPSHPLHLAADGGDVRARRGGRVKAGADGSILGRQPERVVPHRVHDPVAVAAPVQRDHVAHRVVLDVPHVQLARGIGQHLEHVDEPRGVVAGRGVGHVEDPLALPDLLPARLDGGRVIAFHHAGDSRAVGRTCPPLHAPGWSTIPRDDPAPVPVRRDRLRELRVRVHDTQPAGRRRSPRGACGPLSRGRRGDRRAHRGGVRDTRPGRPRLGPARPGRGHRRDGISARPGRGSASIITRSPTASASSSETRSSPLSRRPATRLRTTPTSSPTCAARPTRPGSHSPATRCW